MAKRKPEQKNAMAELNVEVIEVQPCSDLMPRKEELGCWPGRSLGCQKAREWAVFHDFDEAAIKTFNYMDSIYIGTCSEHLSLALQWHPTALNFVRPY